jgi:uncharacterized iron-regulated membrane protein
MAPTRPESVRRALNIWSRRLHRWGAIVTLAPLLLIILTGLALQLRKHWTWVQPAEHRGTGSVPVISFDDILAAARTATDAQIQTWDDIDRLDVRPGKGLIKVRAVNDYEVQLDAQTGTVLHTAYRRSHFFEALHEGAFFGDFVQFGLFFPSGLILLALLATGGYLWFLPILAKRNGRRRRARNTHSSPT